MSSMQYIGDVVSISLRKHRGRERFVVKIQEHLKQKHVPGPQMLTLDEMVFFSRARCVILKQKEDPEDIDLDN